MPRSRHITSYPPEFFSIVEEVGIDGCTVTLEFPDRLAANRWRGAFSVFLGVLRKSEEGAYTGLAKASYQVSSSISGEAPALLSLFPRDQSWFAEAARSRVVKQPEEVTPGADLLALLTKGETKHE